MIAFGLALAAGAGADPAALASEWGSTIATGAGGTTAAVALYYALQARLADMRAELRGEIDGVERAIEATGKRLDVVTDRLGAIGERLSRIEGAMDAERDRERQRGAG